VTVTGIDGAVSGEQVGSHTFAFKTQHTELLRNWDFEKKPAKKKLAPWVVVNATGDKLVCDPAKAYSGQCAFKFKGSRFENATLLQVVNLNGLTFSAGDELILSAFANGVGDVKLKLTLVVSYNGAPADKAQVQLLASSGYTEYTAPTLMLASGDVRSIKVKFKHKSANGRTFVDDVSLKLRQGNARRGGDMPLPVPDIPSGFRGN
jgi:hypothetical protein